MGTSYDYTCKSCGYTAHVSGGKDCGMCAVVETRVCRSCRSVVDVLIGRHGREGPTGDPEYDEDMGKCPECGSPAVGPWSRHRPCPKCGSRMFKGETYALWD